MRKQNHRTIYKGSVPLSGILHVAHDVSPSHAPRTFSRQHENFFQPRVTQKHRLFYRQNTHIRPSNQSANFGKNNMASYEFRLVSPAINHEGRLPRKYTWEGQGALKNLSPPLEWYNVPDGTKTLALVVQDIDAPDPSGPIVPWTIWVVVNIPPTLKRLPEGFSGKGEEMGGEYAGIKEGHTDWKVPGWRGPKLPSHGHRFEFKLYALDDEMHLGNKVTKEKLLEAIEGHVLGEAVLMAIF